MTNSGSQEDQENEKLDNESADNLSLCLLEKYNNSENSENISTDRKIQSDNVNMSINTKNNSDNVSVVSKDSVVKEVQKSNKQKVVKVSEKVKKSPKIVNHKKIQFSNNHKQRMNMSVFDRLSKKK